MVLAHPPPELYFSFGRVNLRATWLCRFFEMQSSPFLFSFNPFESLVPVFSLSGRAHERGVPLSFFPLKSPFSVHRWVLHFLRNPFFAPRPGRRAILFLSAYSFFPQIKDRPRRFVVSPSGGLLKFPSLPPLQKGAQDDSFGFHSRRPSPHIEAALRNSCVLLMERSRGPRIGWLVLIFFSPHNV